MGFEGFQKVYIFNMINIIIMEFTTIRITKKTALKLGKLREDLSETYEDIILKLFKNEEEPKSEHWGFKEYLRAFQIQMKLRIKEKNKQRTDLSMNQRWLKEKLNVLDLECRLNEEFMEYFNGHGKQHYEDNRRIKDLVDIANQAMLLWMTRDLHNDDRKGRLIPYLYDAICINNEKLLEKEAETKE